MKKITIFAAGVATGVGILVGLGALSEAGIIKPLEDLDSTEGPEDVGEVGPFEGSWPTTP